jgi:hypothetical protein
MARNKDLAGTIISVTIAGVTYDAGADGGIKAVPTSHENTAVPTSGRNIHKMVKRVMSREVTLVANGVEQDALKALAESPEHFTLAYATAAGDVYRATGWIEFASHETEENKAEITMFPERDWSVFLGEVV